MINCLKLKTFVFAFAAKGVIRAISDRDGSPYIEAVCGASLKLGNRRDLCHRRESGAGKTTLARSVIGLVTPYEGSILFKGQELCGLTDKAFKPLRRDIAMMFQDPVGCLSPRRTVRACN